MSLGARHGSLPRGPKGIVRRCLVLFMVLAMSGVGGGS